MKKKLILIRHGQSIYNLENKFTGWKDVDLTKKGIEEAIDAGKILKKENIKPDYAFTSVLKRAQKTLNLILQEMNITIPIEYNLALNERDYGSLIGQNKADASKKFGAEQVQIWRRSYDVPPPDGESLKMTCERVYPYMKSNIMSKFDKYDNILISAHGNSIRSIVMKLLNFSPENILKTEIGWCEPWVFYFDDNYNIIDFKIICLNSNSSNSSLPYIPKFKMEKCDD